MKKNNVKYNTSSRHTWVFILIYLFWTTLMAFLLLWAVLNEYDKTITLILSEARSFFTQLVTTRLWNTKHGGVYVPITEETQPNPYLDIPHRDITTLDGKSLTLINPAYMTRQIAEIASVEDQVHFHITSLNPIRPGNAPLEWEARALGSFSKSTDEYYDWKKSPEPNKNKIFRYIAPLVTKTSCLACHAKQGYVKGDIRGGISVSIPANKFIAAQDNHILRQVISFLILWITGILGITFTYRIIHKEYTQRSSLIEQLQKTLKEIKTLKGFIPICASCKKVRNDAGYWDQIEQYIKDHSDAEFTHGICPDCVKKLYPNSLNIKEEE